MASNLTQLLFGTETELGVFAESPGGIRPAPAELAAALIDDVAGRYPHALSPDNSPVRRIFLGNGACVYGDVGGHPEMASAECRSPIELAVQSLALRQMLVESADAVGRAYEMPIRLVANNVDYALGGERTYGHHVNVLLAGPSLEQAVRQLIPLLAVLPVLSGTGKVSMANDAAGFELSQRAGHMCGVMSGRTTESRAMITTKDEPLSKNGVRLHVISIDTAMSPWQLVLAPAVLALSAKAVESGHDIAARLALADPIRALQSVSCDPSLHAELPLARGGVTTALDVLNAYLEIVEETAQKTNLPDWTGTICSLWREMLANLRIDPFLEYGRLDWVTKLVIFTQQLEREGMTWRQFSRWRYVLASFRRLKATWPKLNPQEMAGSEEARAKIRRSALGVLERHLEKNDLSWKDFPAIWRVASQLCHLCVQYHMLSAKPFQDGTVEPSCPLIREGMIHLAKTLPPKGTRGAVRGEAIQEAGPGAEAGWAFVKAGKRRLVMEDAFGKGASWVEERRSTSKESG